jgi:hypothetical protein
LNDTEGFSSFRGCIFLFDRGHCKPEDIYKESERQAQKEWKTRIARNKRLREDEK